MSLEYVFGPVIAQEPTLINTHLQLFRVYDRQAKQHGWAWSADNCEDLEYEGGSTRGDYALDPYEAIEDLVDALRRYLTNELEDYFERKEQSRQKNLQKTSAASTP